MTELISGDPNHSLLKSEIFSKIGVVREYWLIVVLFSRADRAHCIAVKEKFRETNSKNSLGIPKVESAGKELIYCNSWSKAVKTSSITANEAKDFLTASWELIEKVEVGIQTPNLIDGTAHPVEVCYVYGRNPKIRMSENIYGGVLYSPKSQTKSWRFIKAVKRMISGFNEKPD